VRKLLNFINGRYCEPASGKFLESFNPATGEPHLLLADSNSVDIDVAVRAAQQAFSAWAARTPTERSHILLKVAELIEINLDKLSEAESSDQGKPVWLAKSMDIPRAAHNFRFFATSLTHQIDAANRMDEATMNFTSHRPVGVAGLISPWNLPLYLLTWKIAPAIAYGNTVVCKPSEITSLTAYLLCDILKEAGVPAGVVNMVFGVGSRAGQALVEHRDVPLISFTGGTSTGRSIAATAAPMFKKLSLELGGKNPNIIFDDADLDEAIESTLRSSFLNQGEICLCGSRIYVQRKVYATFLEKFAAKARALKVGDPRQESTFTGPLVSREHLEKVQNFLTLAREEKVQILVGGQSPANLPENLKRGYFLEPTILTGVRHESKLQQEEIFGPVVTVTAFDSDDEVLKFANGTRYGLSATVWTQSLKRAHTFAEKLAAGTVWVNCWMVRDLRVPFGGVKESGTGREGQDGSREFFTEAKNICIRHGS
jgi:aminomuconate-semialdehyde/2-hydroxymuconate-6-semialdehyde dehydrogenase